MSFVWTLAEQDGTSLKGVSFELLARGRTLADKLETKLASVVIGGKLSEEQLQELIHRGADEVYYIKNDALDDFVVETYSRILVKLIEQYDPHTILAAATTTGRTLMPHVSIGADTGLTADCTDLDIDPETGQLLQTRPAIGGNIMATIKTPYKRPQMATVRPKSSRPLEADTTREGKIIEVPFEESFVDGRVEVLGYRHNEDEDVDIQEAEMVISGGRGLKKGDNFEIIRKLATRFDAAIGASRDAVDRGWISYPHQVGLSGKTISPKLYFACGISGSIQQLAGIKTAETIVAVNNDPEANIHKIADFSIVGDLFEVLPRLIEKLDENGKKATGGKS
ncbi:MAG: electron transfer flavoprotein subunit alpha/FixB family protein [Spirochaetota bacterium]